VSRQFPDKPEPAEVMPPFISRQVEQSRLFFLEYGGGDFEVTCGGFEHCRPDYRMERAGLDWFCLEFVSAGYGRLRMDGMEESLRPGSIFLHGPGTAHCIESDARRPLAKYFVGFAGSGAAEFLREYDMLPGFISRCLRPDPVRSSFDTLIERGIRKSALVKPLCEAIARQLLLLCKDDAVTPGNTETAAFASYVRARKMIEVGFLTLGSLDAVAAACRLDAPYLCRLFARFHDESPYQYLIRLKMGHAATLLLEGGKSVRETALALGYADPFHFSRVFKSVHQVPPSRFRTFMKSPPSPESRGGGPA
jgi:AraC-like DNA-binding protein